MVLMLFVGVRSNSQEIVGIAVKIAVSLTNEQYTSTRFMSRFVN